MSDLGVVGNDPLLPAVDDDAAEYLTPLATRLEGRRGNTLTGSLDRAALVAVDGARQTGRIALNGRIAVPGTPPGTGAPPLTELPPREESFPPGGAGRERPSTMLRRLRVRQPAAAWAIGGFAAVVAVAAGSALAGVPPTTLTTERSAVDASRPIGSSGPPADPGLSTGRQDAGVAERPGPTATTGASSSTTKPRGSAAPGSARTALLALPVAERSAAVLDPASAGPPVDDLDGDGCHVGDDILRRDLVATRVAADGCSVLAGTLRDPYLATTQLLRATAGGPAGVAVDRVVSAASAWQTGGSRLTADRWQAFVDDPVNLVTTTTAAARSKAGADAATWLPPSRAFRCQYVARQIEVKKVYRLWVTSTERAAMLKVLGSCPAQPLPDPVGLTPPPRLDPRLTGTKLPAPDASTAVVPSGGSPAARPTGPTRRKGPPPPVGTVTASPATHSSSPAAPGPRPAAADSGAAITPADQLP